MLFHHRLKPLRFPDFFEQRLLIYGNKIRVPVVQRAFQPVKGLCFSALAGGEQGEAVFAPEPFAAQVKRVLESVGSLLQAVLVEQKITVAEQGFFFYICHPESAIQKQGSCTR